MEGDHFWWCVMEHDQEQLDQHFFQELHSLGWNKGVGKDGYKGGYKSYQKGGSKGSSNDFKGVGKGDFNKGVLKDDGQGKGGKGGGRLQWVSPLVRGVMGEIMEKENQRRYGKGNSEGGYDQITHTVEENKNQLENLEKIWGVSLLVLLGTPWQSLCYFEPVRGIARTR